MTAILISQPSWIPPYAMVSSSLISVLLYLFHCLCCPFQPAAICNPHICELTSFTFPSVGSLLQSRWMYLPTKYTSSNYPAIYPPLSSIPFVIQMSLNFIYLFHWSFTTQFSFWGFRCRWYILLWLQSVYSVTTWACFVRLSVIWHSRVNVAAFFPEQIS